MKGAVSFKYPPFTQVLKFSKKGGVLSIFMSRFTIFGWVFCYVIYGFINGAKVLTQAAKTNAIVSAIVA